MNPAFDPTTKGQIMTNSPPPNAADWIGRTAIGDDGKIGRIAEIYLDDPTGQPEWLAIKTGLLGSKLSFVPLAGATAEGDDIRVPFSKSHVKDAPNVEDDGHLEPAEEAALYRHYGRTDYEASTADSGRAAPTGPSDKAMTRSEEELRISKSSREAGKARLRKYVVTENVNKTVPVQREEVRLSREPITEANRDKAMTGDELSEAEHEVVLHGEEVVVDKRTVPKERVRLGKEVVVEQQEVSGQVRKEQIELDDDLQ